MPKPVFKNRKLLIATKHGKEKVIAPILEAALGVKCIVNEDFDTDSLGTFTGEVERELDPVANARQKCLMAMAQSNCDLGVASEGSFGAHPSLFFVNADDEFLMFIDQKNKLEIIVRELSMETNFNGQEVRSLQELTDFCERVKFPSHAVILRASKTDTAQLVKGITDTARLEEAFHALLKTTDTVYAETDMRAMYNPTRMQVIQAAAQKLADKINSCCPSCETPGFGITAVKPGLACKLCGSPTKSTLSHSYTCQDCEYTKEVRHPHGKTFEDPMYCDYCNP
ncbi:hypothetical protein G3567_04055 [Psychroflexus sp. YR1-1]|uniref:DUF6671 domain-containing protein n=1 Tax=Psychroflexus aurantiacus TaxID=2709310 RepID=A0A6B3R738_9FLAO|nr:DUF6671 family protein [Psychroflexus aurantiacus]NEV93324.1 hypothetical protein [Psychroflexus aurantiacus]